jgi:hypothetical protein
MAPFGRHCRRVENWGGISRKAPVATAQVRAPSDARRSRGRAALTAGNAGYGVRACDRGRKAARVRRPRRSVFDRAGIGTAASRHGLPYGDQADLDNHSPHILQGDEGPARRATALRNRCFFGMKGNGNCTCPFELHRRKDLCPMPDRGRLAGRSYGARAASESFGTKERGEGDMGTFYLLLC